MRRELREPVLPPTWPVGVHLVDFTPNDAKELHDLLSLAYTTGGGEVAAFEPWWKSLSTDFEFDPALCFIARDGERRIAGAAQCWTAAFVKDLVVHPNWRRRGIGEALLLHTFGVFRARGAAAVDLKVRVDNAGALRLYARVGMRAVTL